jgi:hypothetical protein
MLPERLSKNNEVEAADDLRAGLKLTRSLRVN